jgi:hypothetical protein
MARQAHFVDRTRWYLANWSKVGIYGQKRCSLSNQLHGTRKGTDSSKGLAAEATVTFESVRRAPKERYVL